MQCNLYIRLSSYEGLEVVAARLADILGVQPLTMRESSNYPGDRYMTGRALALVIRLAEADDSEFPDYHYWLNLTARPTEASVNLNALDGFGEVLARELSTHGFDVALALEF